MVTTDPRADELLADRVARYGGRWNGREVLDEWGLAGGGRRRVSRLSRSQHAFALPLADTKRPSIALAVLDLLQAEPFVTAALVSTAGVFRDFLAGGFPVAGMHARTLRPRLFVGWDDRKRQAVSTVGITGLEDLAQYQLIALSEQVGWYTQL